MWADVFPVAILRIQRGDTVNGLNYIATALDDAGALSCWGQSYYGALGNVSK